MDPFRSKPYLREQKLQQQTELPVKMAHKLAHQCTPRVQAQEEMDKYKQRKTKRQFLKEQNKT